MDENNCWINPKVADLWGLENGQYIWLKNQDDIISDFPIRVRITERIRWDSIYMVHGFGHTDQRLGRSFRKDRNIRRELEEWINQVWAEKDALIAQIKAS